MHTLNSFLQSSAPTKNFALPSPLPEREKNKQWTRWAITVHRISCSAKEKIDRCNFYAYENLLPNYSREYFYKVKTKKHHSKNSLYYTEKNPRFVRVFFKILYTLLIFHFTITKKIPLYNTEKNSSFVDVFLEKIFNLVLKFTRLSIAMLFVK